LQRQKLSDRSRNASASRLSLAIKCGANLLPVKGMLYAMAYANASGHVSRSTRRGADEARGKMSKQMKELALLASDLQRLRAASGSELYKGIKLAVISYVDLFYSLDSRERDLFITGCVPGRSRKKIMDEQNLLLIPAIMASRGEPKAKVTEFLISGVYKIPFRVLYHSSKAAIHIELLQQAMGLKGTPEASVKRFSDVLERVNDKMESIEEGDLRPEADENLKDRFVAEAVLLSQTTNMKIADFISERVMPNAFTDRLARKTIRRL
jgi:hypothetical protein